MSGSFGREPSRIYYESLVREHDDGRYAAILSAPARLSLATDPPGADLSFKAYDDLDGQWLSIGTSPVSGVSVPGGLLRWRLTKAGFDPLEARLEQRGDRIAALLCTVRRHHRDQRVALERRRFVDQRIGLGRKVSRRSYHPE